ncbi:hypothetical protein B566_EDAN016102 [Ephemera danica]|nr:hypothetical protein B566_EDAN016102 [Ephemera danica]
MPHLKNVAKPSINKVEYRWLQGDLAPQSPPCQDFDDDDEMQKESIIRPPDMLCAIYSLPADANPAELGVQNVVVSSESCTDNNTRVILQEQENLDLVLDTTDDMDSFCSRCLLCTCRPDATPHIEIFSEAGDQLHLAEKLDNSLNIQIEPGLPQRVCRICVEKLDVTYELVTSSKRAKIMLLQIKQRIKNCSMEVTPTENVDIQLTPPFQIKEIPMEDSDSTLSTNVLDRPSEKPTMADTTKTVSFQCFTPEISKKHPLVLERKRK